ncbi:MAG: hypothetical protein LBQ66_15905, partial [Planctomycetaceae bacterium]|nr:hypothetical protein [Planctomycetaceae bacterium]
MANVPQHVLAFLPNSSGFLMHLGGRDALVIPHIFSGLSFIFTLIPCIVVLACSVWIGTTPEVLN